VRSFAFAAPSLALSMRGPSWSTCSSHVAFLLNLVSQPLTRVSPRRQQYRDPEEVERDLENVAAAKALETTTAPTTTEAQGVSEWEIAGPNAAIAAVASTAAVPTFESIGSYPSNRTFLSLSPSYLHLHSFSLSIPYSPCLRRHRKKRRRGLAPRGASCRVVFRFGRENLTHALIPIQLVRK
jgi:hypothetical protein